MNYFNYLIKCIIRRFLRLFFTKKTFIIILIFISLFVFLKSEGYCVSEKRLNRSLILMNRDSSGYRICNSVVSASLSSNVINVPTYYYVYYLQPGHTYRFDYPSSSAVICKVTYDLSFANYLTDFYDISNKTSSTISSSSITGTTSTTGTGSDLGSGSMSTSSFSEQSTSTTTYRDDSGQYFTVYNLSSYSIVPGYTFTSSVGFYLLFTSEDADISSLSLIEIEDYATSSDINTQTNTIKDSSQATQNTIKDSSQQMQNTIKDSNVTVDTDLPEDNTTDITEDGFNNIFTIIRNTFTSSSSQDLVLTIPFTAKSFTINFANVYRWF